MSPRRCSPTTAYACCCATNSASPPARPCRASTGVCWARELRHPLRNLLRLRQEVRARDLADEIRMVLPHVLLRVLPELVVVLALDDLATNARDLLHPLIVCGEDLNTKEPLQTQGDTPVHGSAPQCRFSVDAEAVPLRAPAHSTAGRPQRCIFRAPSDPVASKLRKLDEGFTK